MNKKTPFHVYAEDGFDSAYASDAAAVAAAKRLAKGRRLHSRVIVVGAGGYTGAGQGRVAHEFDATGKAVAVQSASSRTWFEVGRVGSAGIRDFGRFAKLGDYLVQGDETEAGSNQLYGIGEDYIDEADTLLSVRGLKLEPDHLGLVVVRE